MVSKTRTRRARFSGVAAFAALLAAVLPAAASAACPQAELSQPFQQFGDSSYYQLAPGGSFEGSTAGWVFQSGLLGLVQQGVAVDSGNESYNLAPGSHSLSVGSNGMAVSPWVCISSEYPTWRFVARRTGGTSSVPLNVGLRWVNLLGVGVETGAGSLTSNGSWAPSPVMKLGNSVPLWLPGGTALVQLVFHSGAGAWSIDDVYLDPYRR